MIGFDTSLRLAVQELAAARRPAILVGPEGTPAALLLLEMAERLGAAVLTTPDAKSVIDHRHSSGTFSFGAPARARRIVERADVVLAVSALGEFSCRLGEAFRQQRVIQVTESVMDVGRNLEPAVSLVGTTIAATIALLCAELLRLIPNARKQWFTEPSGHTNAEAMPTARPGFIHPIAAIGAVQAALPEAVRVCLDVTSGALHAYERLAVTTLQRVFSSIEHSACMSEALLASLGIRLASNLPTLALVGDWGFCMAPAELHTAVELELDRYVVLIWANSGGAFIGAGVEQQGISVPDRAWHWRSPPDFVRVANGYGARGVVVKDAEALQHELTRALRGAGPGGDRGQDRSGDSGSCRRPISDLGRGATVTAAELIRIIGVSHLLQPPLTLLLSRPERHRLASPARTNHAASGRGFDEYGRRVGVAPHRSRHAARSLSRTGPRTRPARALGALVSAFWCWRLYRQLFALRPLWPRATAGDWWLNALLTLIFAVQGPGLGLLVICCTANFHCV